MKDFLSLLYFGKTRNFIPVEESFKTCLGWKMRYEKAIRGLRIRRKRMLPDFYSLVRRLFASRHKVERRTTPPALVRERPTKTDVLAQRHAESSSEIGSVRGVILGLRIYADLDSSAIPGTLAGWEPGPHRCFPMYINIYIYIYIYIHIYTYTHTIYNESFVCSLLLLPLHLASSLYSRIHVSSHPMVLRVLCRGDLCAYLESAKRNPARLSGRWNGELVEYSALHFHSTRTIMIHSTRALAYDCYSTQA